MITDRLLHIHIYRTGGLFVREVLRSIPGLKIYSDQLHMTYEQMATKAQDYMGYVPPAIAFVRNPYSWYVSMWGRIWWDPGVPFVGIFREYMEAIKDNSIDDENFVTFSGHWRVMGVDGAIYIGRYESLYEGMRTVAHGALSNWGTASDHLDNLMNRQPRFHPAREYPSGKRITDWRQYHDKDTKRWVEDWDGELIEGFGYGFA